MSTESTAVQTVAGSEIQRADAAPPPTSILDIMADAIGNPSVSVEVLERLQAMHYRHEDREARMSFNRAMACFQQNCPAIPRDQKVNFVSRQGGRVNYDFAKLETIQDTIRAPLMECGLSYTFDIVVDGGILTATCIVRHVDGHEQRASFQCPTEQTGKLNAKMSPAQKVGSADTYARRRCLANALGLNIGGEIDPDGVVGGAGGERIDGDQYEDLQNTMTDMYPENTRERLERIAARYNVSSLTELTRTQYDSIMATLADVRQQREG